MTDASCYRVPIAFPYRRLEPIIEAATPEEAAEKARSLGFQLNRRRLPWHLERGATKPPKTADEPLFVVGEPRRLHDSAHRELGA